MSSPLLEIINLRTSFGEGENAECAVDGISFSINRGQTFGLLGESGSGKSVTALSIMRLLPAAARINQGNIFLDGMDLLTIPEFAISKYIKGQSNSDKEYFSRPWVYSKRLQPTSIEE